MSTASGNPPYVVEPSDHESSQAPEPHSGQPHEQIETSREDSLQSPYAPKPPHERAAARLHVVDNDQDKISPFIPRRRRSPAPGAPVEAELSASSSVAPSDEEAAAGAEAAALVPEQGAGAPPKEVAQPGLTHKEAPAGQQGSEIRCRIIADRHLDEIEASLRLLQRRPGAALRLPRGPVFPAPPESIPVPRGATGGAHRSHSGLFAGLPRPRSLDPTPMSPPVLPPARNPHAMLGVAVACIAAAIAGYWLVDGSLSRPAAPTKAALTTSSPLLVNALNSSQAESDDKPEWWRARATGLAKGDLEFEKQPEPGASRVALVSPAPAVEAPAAVPVPSPKQVEHRVLRPEEIRLLIEQGEKFMAAGDIVTARMIFERAAQSEDATAALALGAAYDPLVLSKLGVLGMHSSLEKARVWYAKAQSLGSTQAIARLKALEDR
jgi:hypothetical protein